MEQPIQEIQYNGYIIQIYQDLNFESPREWDNLGKMCYKHRNYTLGDIEIPEYYLNDYGDSFDINDKKSFVEWFENEHGTIAVMLPLYIYDHSGVTMYTQGSTVYHQHEGWDSSMVGWIVATKKQVRKEHGVKRISKKILDQTEKILQSEIQTFDDCLTGNVYGYTVQDETGEQTELSCWGFYGDYNNNGMLDEVKSEIDSERDKREQEHEKKTKAYIVNKVPLEYRMA